MLHDITVYYIKLQRILSYLIMLHQITVYYIILQNMAVTAHYNYNELQNIMITTNQNSLKHIITCFLTYLLHNILQQISYMLQYTTTYYFC